jgi:hypothetical protein
MIRLQARLNSEKAAAFSKFALRMMNIQVSRAFHTWQINVHEVRRMSTICTRIASRLRNATVFKALITWDDHTKVLRRQRGIVMRVAMRMRNAGVFAALHRWRENTTEKKAMVAKSTRCKSIKSLCVYLVTKRTMYACA